MPSSKPFMALILSMGPAVLAGSPLRAEECAVRGRVASAGKATSATRAARTASASSRASSWPICPPPTSRCGCAPPTFRTEASRFYVALSVAVPASALPAPQAAGKAKEQGLDVIGIVRDEAKRAVARVRDTVSVNTGEASRKSLQYRTTFTLPPGRYTLRGNVRRYETPIVEAAKLGAGDRKAAVFQLSVPAGSLAPGLYTCQVNVIDDVAGAFTFPRLALLVRP